jgi:hypothetical protein
MSDLILPPGYARNAASDAAALKRANEQAAAKNTFEPYYGEARKIVEVSNKLNRIFAWSGEEPWTERQFETTAMNMFGEIGIEIQINWLQAYDPETGEELDFKAPEVIPVGRVSKETERDHDRLQHEIVTGVADGQAGYIREDGTKREDPIKKIIV